MDGAPYAGKGENNNNNVYDSDFQRLFANYLGRCLMYAGPEQMLIIYFPSAL